MDKQYVVKMVLMEVIEQNGKHLFYFDTFSEGDYAKLDLLMAIEKEILEVPLNKKGSLDKIFQELYRNYQTDCEEKVFANKVAYELDDEKYKQVRKWINSYRGITADMIDEIK